MYEYEDRKDKSSIKGVIVQILLLVMFIFILICLFPTKSDLDKLKTTQSVSSLEPLYDRIFNDNIILMKDSAKSYYTTPRLPKNVGDSVSMTLREMLNKKIILPFTDSKGKQCDLEESYVMITKEDEEFVMKVNLKCSNQENYLLVVMGCYEYCETGICEKDTNDVSAPTINQSKPSTIIKEEIIRPIINNNIIINNNCTSDNCKPTEYRCQYVDGKYYGIGGVVVSEADYKVQCTASPDPKPPVTQYQCKYMKTTNSSYTSWSNWSDWTEKRQTTSSLKEERKKIVTQQVQEKQLVGYEIITFKDPKKPIYGPKQVLIGTRTETSCAEYGYVYTSNGSIDSNVTYGEWKSEGLVKLYTTPINTSTERYTRVSSGTETCDECGARYYTIYKKETRTVSKGSSSTSTYKCLRNVSQEVPVYGTRNVIVDFDTSTKTEKVYGLVPVEKKITFYSYRTRSVTGGTVDYQISNCNDTYLFNNGYHIIDKWEV